MREIIWSPLASTDLYEQLEYIGRDSPQNAVLVRERVMAAAARLAKLSIGRPGRVIGTYEIPVQKTSLILAYQFVKADLIEILRLVHMARDWQPGKWPAD
jgi:toxin ParE1/3/4